MNQWDKPTTCQKVSDSNNDWEYFWTEYPTFVDPISKNQPTFEDSISESQPPPHSPPLENSSPRNTLDSSSNNPAQITLESPNNIPQNPNHIEIISPTLLPTQQLLEPFAQTYSRRKTAHKQDDMDLFVCYRDGSPELSAKESGGRQFYLWVQVWG